MKESTLWGHLRSELNKRGLFQKISDRFTPGVPDVLGVLQGIPVAIENKELKGVRVVKTKFRPRQLDWLRDWEVEGGVSLILSSHGPTVYLHHWSWGTQLEEGVDPQVLRDSALMIFIKNHKTRWEDCAKEIRDEITRANS